MSVERAAVDDFLAQRRIAFVGASRDPKSFNNAVYRHLRDGGRTLLPVHPSAAEIEGDPCVPRIADLPPVDGVLVMVPADAAGDVVRQAVEAGIRRVWLYRGGGRGAVSDEAVARCREAGVEVVAGACPFMFDEPVRGIHRLHRFISGRRIAV